MFSANCLEVIVYTLWISSCIAMARERIPGSIDNYVTGVSAANKEAT
ncbi:MULTISPECIES: hypothetical protein [Photorhabdus]|uniref:Uncharacterized protein n=1 Tax=Photorhabdus bodei TaxID=2029681 RepID=A0AAW6BGC7_9GAMM|nr:MULTISPECIES: hypothetical protein [Photorhabdus]MCT8352632.1 hypothetical protein [Photorhabdus kayaii]MDB6372143.1 hypothetical protein [Photorhabdus bodei]